MVWQATYTLTPVSLTSQRIAIDTSSPVQIYVSQVAGSTAYTNIYNLSGVWQQNLISGTGAYRGMALDTFNNIYVTIDDGTTTKFTSSWVEVWSVTPPAIGGLSINTPQGLAYCHDHIYMTDSGNNRILIFDTLMNYVGLWNSYNDGGTIKNFSGLTDIVGDTTTGHIFVGNAGTSEILKLQGLTS